MAERAGAQGQPLAGTGDQVWASSSNAIVGPNENELHSRKTKKLLCYQVIRCIHIHTGSKKLECWL